MVFMLCLFGFICPNMPFTKQSPPKRQNIKVRYLLLFKMFFTPKKKSQKPKLMSHLVLWKWLATSFLNERRRLKLWKSQQHIVHVGERVCVCVCRCEYASKVMLAYTEYSIGGNKGEWEESGGVHYNMWVKFQFKIKEYRIGCRWVD